MEAPPDWPPHLPQTDVGLRGVRRCHTLLSEQTTKGAQGPAISVQSVLTGMSHGSYSHCNTLLQKCDPKWNSLHVGHLQLTALKKGPDVLSFKAVGPLMSFCHI